MKLEHKIRHDFLPRTPGGAAKTQILASELRSFVAGLADLHIPDHAEVVFTAGDDQQDGRFCNVVVSWENEV